jgi:hypothetical protein
MTTATHTDDDIRALFGEHLDGTLDDATMLLVNEALSTRPELAAEYRALSETVAALHALPRIEAPADLAARVRARLGDDTPALNTPAANDNVAAAPSWWSTSRVATGIASFAVAAAVAGVFVTASPRTMPGAADTGMMGAAVVDNAVVVEWSGPTFNTAALLDVAQTAGMEFRPDTREFVGNRATTAAFFVELKGLAVSMGGDLQGQVPQGADLVVVRLR